MARARGIGLPKALTIGSRTLDVGPTTPPERHRDGSTADGDTQHGSRPIELDGRRTSGRRARSIDARPRPGCVALVRAGSRTRISSLRDLRPICSLDSRLLSHVWARDEILTYRAVGRGLTTVAPSRQEDPARIWFHRSGLGETLRFGVGPSGSRGMCSRCQAT